MKMTKRQWLNRMTDIGGLVRPALIKAIWGEDLKDVEEYLLNARCKEDYEHDIEVFKKEIDLAIVELEKLKDKIHIPYEEII